MRLMFSLGFAFGCFRLYFADPPSNINPVIYNFDLYLINNNQCSLEELNQMNLSSLNEFFLLLLKYLLFPACLSN